jgi:hypothetical protein
MMLSMPKTISSAASVKKAMRLLGLSINSSMIGACREWLGSLTAQVTHDNGKPLRKQYELNTQKQKRLFCDEYKRMNF